MLYDLVATLMDQDGAPTVLQKRYMEATSAQVAAMLFVAELPEDEREQLVDVSAFSSVEIHLVNRKMEYFCVNTNRYLDEFDRNHRSSFFKDFSDGVVFVDGYETLEPEALVSKPVREAWRAVQ